MNLNKLKLFTDPLESTETMPVLFVGHGSPMNAIAQNEFTTSWETQRQKPFCAYQHTGKPKAPL